jgi:hypothetical protein
VAEKVVQEEEEGAVEMCSGLIFYVGNTKILALPFVLYSPVLDWGGF